MTTTVTAQDEATPRPWGASKAYSSVVGVPVIGPHGERIANTAMHSAVDFPDIRRRCVADAALICKAVNGYEAMVMALREADAAINPPDRGGISLAEWNERLKKATTIIRDALKAGGAA